LTFEDVMNIVDVEKPDGVIVQFGGQTPLNLAKRLSEAGVPIIGTSVASIETAENRQKFSRLIGDLGLQQPQNGSAFSVEEAVKIAGEIGYPVLARPSYVLGGRAMRIVYDEQALLGFIEEAQEVSEGHPVLIDKFIDDAIEMDVDAVSDGTQTFVAGIMEHIENAGIHSGDSACVLPPPTVSESIIEQIKENTCRIAKALNVVGLLNIQYAIKGRRIYVLEVNPRASRTVPFVSKATGVPLAKIAARVMVGEPLEKFNLSYDMTEKLHYVSVKESVLPFSRFSGVDVVLGPEMKSTGEVMGIGLTVGEAFAKSQISAGQGLPREGRIFLSVRDEDKREIVSLAKRLERLGYSFVSTKGTAKVLRTHGTRAREVGRYEQGHGDFLNLITLIKQNEIALVVNTPSGEGSQHDMRSIRAAAILHNVPCITTIQGAREAVNAMEEMKVKKFSVQSLQRYYSDRRNASCAVS
jgi:carbamoyl-phosphate synthase large subunit